MRGCALAAPLALALSAAPVTRPARACPPSWSDAAGTAVSLTMPARCLFAAEIPFGAFRGAFSRSIIDSVLLEQSTYDTNPSDVGDGAPWCRDALFRNPCRGPHTRGAHRHDDRGRTAAARRAADPASPAAVRRP